jgi:hypothetical protein
VQRAGGSDVLTRGQGVVYAQLAATGGGEAEMANFLRGFVPSRPSRPVWSSTQPGGMVLMLPVCIRFLSQCSCSSGVQHIQFCPALSYKCFHELYHSSC